MSATVAAALKKLAVAVITDKKTRKVVIGIVLGILVLLIMPVIAVVSIFNGSIEIDTARLQEMVMQNLSAEDMAMLQAVEDTMLAIEDEMTAAGFAERTQEAQVLYALALSDTAHEPEFVPRLVGCFADDQTDEQLIAAVNETFGTAIESDEFTNTMQSIRAKAENTEEVR